jgi:hypothetical protein
MATAPSHARESGLPDSGGEFVVSVFAVQWQWSLFCSAVAV